MGSKPHFFCPPTSSRDPLAACVECGLGSGAAVHGIADVVNHPSHYGGAENPFEAIKVIEAWELGFCLGNAVKYICRAGKKWKAGADPTGGDTLAAELEDLKKARWYLDREIQNLEKR